MILIAFQEALQILGLEAALESAGHHVESASTLDEAVQVLEREQVALAIIGLNLPTTLDGAALARRLTDQGVPVIVYTGLPDSTARGALADVAPAAVVAKPVSDAAMLELVGQVLQRRQV